MAVNNSVTVTKEMYDNYGCDGQLRLSQGFFIRFCLNKFELKGERPVVQIDRIVYREKENAKQLRARIHDGAFISRFFFFNPCLLDQLEREEIRGEKGVKGDVIAITALSMDDTRSFTDGGKTFSPIRVDGYELLAHDVPQLGKPTDFKPIPEKLECYEGYRPQTILSIPWNIGVAGLATLETHTPMEQVTSKPPAARPAPGRPATGRSMSTGQQNVTPVRMITPYVGKWRICGVCTGKGDLRPILNGESKVFNFFITDKDGDAIKVAVYGETTAERICGIIECDQLYYVAGGSVEQENKRYNVTGHDYQLKLNCDYEVTPCHDHVMPKPEFTLKVCPLDRIVNHKDETVDILAIIDHVGEVVEFTSRAGKAFTKREVSVIDRTGTMAQLTLWGDQGRQFDAENKGHVVAIKGAQVKEWNGGFTLGVIEGTQIKVGVQMTGVPELFEWYENERPNALVKTLTGAGGGGGEASFVRDHRLIGTLVTLQLGSDQDDPQGCYQNIKGYINQIKKDNVIYQGCAQEKCSKKLVMMEENSWRCKKCNMTTDTYKWKYALQVTSYTNMYPEHILKVFSLLMEICDATGSIWGTCFGDAAKDIVGMDADALGQMKLDDPSAYENVLNECRFKTFSIRIRAKAEVYNDESRVKYHVFKAEPVPYQKVVSSLESTLRALDSL